MKLMQLCQTCSPSLPLYHYQICCRITLRYFSQVENYLMLSEYEQNLIKEIEGPPGSLLTGRRARKWSLVRQASRNSLLQAEEGRRRGWRMNMNTIMEDRDSSQSGGRTNMNTIMEDKESLQ